MIALRSRLKSASANHLPSTVGIGTNHKLSVNSRRSPAQRWVKRSEKSWTYHKCVASRSKRFSNADDGGSVAGAASSLIFSSADLNQLGSWRQNGSSRPLIESPSYHQTRLQLVNQSNQAKRPSWLSFTPDAWTGSILHRCSLLWIDKKVAMQLGLTFGSCPSVGPSVWGKKCERSLLN